MFELVNRIGADHIRFNIETKLTPSLGHDVPDPELFAKAVAAAVRDAGLTERVSIHLILRRREAPSRRMAAGTTFRLCPSFETRARARSSGRGSVMVHMIRTSETLH